MSGAYDAYLSRHIKAVNNVFQWLKANCYDDINDLFAEILKYREGVDSEAPFIIKGVWSTAEKNISKHDESSYSVGEYDIYDGYYGFTDREVSMDEYAVARLRHIHSNPHHWEYWVLVKYHNCRGGITVGHYEIPWEYVLEMICDWIAIFTDVDNIGELNLVNGHEGLNFLDWWEMKSKLIDMNKNTYRLVTEIIRIIVTHVNRKKKEEEERCSKT